MKPFNSVIWISNTSKKWMVSAVVLILAALFGYKTSPIWLILLAGGIGGAILIQWPILGLLALTPAALVVRMEIGTGTAITLNPVTLLLPILLIVWLLDMVYQRGGRLTPSSTNCPLFLFLLSGLLSFLVGNVLWDSAVPRSNSFTIVQAAQWGIFAFSAGAYWLMGNVVRDEPGLRRMAFSFLVVGGGLAIPYVIPKVGPMLYYQAHIFTLALNRPPFWMLLTAVAGGQLLFNRELSAGWRFFLLSILGAELVFALYWNQESASTWIGIATVGGVLAWLRWPQMRRLVIVVLLVLAGTGILSSTLYSFSGGDDEWEESGGSRLTLINRVVEVTMRNPITGLGPAAYRPYAAMRPLLYGKAFWVAPQINSHNNYIDLFSQVGLLGLGLFFWFAVELFRLGLRLRTYFTQGFAAGYVNGMLAAWAGTLVLMLFADWILPFVYNIGFPGFQASVLVWLFLGGLVALEQMARREVVS